MIRLSSKDFSFITEDKLSGIFNKLYDYQIKVNLMQNSAISLSLCLEDKYNNLDQFVADMNEAFKVQVENDVLLYTIRHFDADSDKVVSKEKEFDWLFQDACLYDFSIDVGLTKVGNIHDNPELINEAV